MNRFKSVVIACLTPLSIHAGAQSMSPLSPSAATSQFQPVPELPYRMVANFFKFPKGMVEGEATGVAINSKGHIFLFQRTKPMLAEYDARGNFIQSIGEGLFSHPHGLRIDADDNLWTTDDGSHLVLKLSPAGRVLLVLRRKGVAAESDWLFKQPKDVAFGKHGEIYVSDGYGNSRVVKFDRDVKFIKAWGQFGTGPGEFNLPHSVVVDDQENVYVADRENKRIQIFDADGKFLREWTGIGY